MKSRGSDGNYSSPFELSYLEKTRDSRLICIPILLLLIVTIPYTMNGYLEDEIFSVVTSRSWSGLFGIFREYENNMSLYYVVLHIWMGIFGEGEMATHSLSLLFALLTIPVFYKLERIWLNKTTALAGGLLLAANPLFITYAVESRSYSFLVLATTLSTLIFVRLLRKPGFLTSICYGLSIAAGVYIHYFGILLLGVHALAIPLKNLTRLRLASFLLSGLVILISVLPLFFFPPRDRSQVDWISKPDPALLGHTLKDLVGGWGVVLVLIICLFIIVRKGYWKNAADTEYFLPRLSLVWTIVPACLIFLFSCLIKPVFLTRYFVWCLPGATLLICLIVGYTRWSHFRKSVVLLLMLSVLLIRSYGILNAKGSGYLEAARYLNENIRSGESVLTYPYYKSIQANYYLDKMGSPNPFAKPLAITSLPFTPGGGGRDPDPDMETLRRVAAGKGKIYLICRERADQMITDSLQNRRWLPEIQKIIINKHPRRQERVFGVGSQEPMHIIVYE